MEKNSFFSSDVKESNCIHSYIIFIARLRTNRKTCCKILFYGISTCILRLFYTFAIHIAHKCPDGVTDEIIHIKYYTMLNANDLEQLKAKGISEKQIEEQLACFVKVSLSLR